MILGLARIVGFVATDRRFLEAFPRQPLEENDEFLLTLITIEVISLNEYCLKRKWYGGYG